MADLQANSDSMHPPRVANNSSPHNSTPLPQSTPFQKQFLASSLAPPQSKPSPPTQLQLQTSPLTPPPKQVESYVPPQRKQTPTSTQSGSVVMHQILREAMPKSIRLLNLILRVLAVVLTLISFIVIATDSHRVSTGKVGHVKRGSMDVHRIGNKRKPHYSSASHAAATSWIRFNTFSTYN